MIAGAWYGDALGIGVDARAEHGCFGHDFPVREVDGGRRPTRRAWAIFSVRVRTKLRRLVFVNDRVDNLEETPA